VALAPPTGELTSSPVLLLALLPELVPVLKITFNTVTLHAKQTNSGEMMIKNVMQSATTQELAAPLLKESAHALFHAQELKIGEVMTEHALKVALLPE